MLQNGTERLLEEGGILEASGVARRVDEVAAADVEALAASLAHPLLGPMLSAGVGDIPHCANAASLRVDF